MIERKLQIVCSQTKITTLTVYVHNIKRNRFTTPCIICISQCKRTNCAQIHHWVRYVNWWSLRNHLEPYTALANYIHFPLELISLLRQTLLFFVTLDCTCAYMHSVCCNLSKVLVNFWCINLILSIEVLFIEFHVSKSKFILQCCAMDVNLTLIGTKSR